MRSELCISFVFFWAGTIKHVTHHDLSSHMLCMGGRSVGGCPPAPKELVALRGRIKRQRATLIAALCRGTASFLESKPRDKNIRILLADLVYLATSPLVKPNASDEGAVTLSGIKQLYESLSFPDILAREKSIPAGKSAPLTSFLLDLP